MKDIRSVSFSERVPLLTTQESNFSLLHLSNGSALALSEEPYSFDKISEYLLSRCFCKLSICNTKSTFENSEYKVCHNPDSRKKHVHFIIFDQVYKGKMSRFEVIQTSDLSCLTLISTVNWLGLHTVIDCFFKCSPNFAILIPSSWNASNNGIFISNFGSLFDGRFKLLLSDTNSVAKSFVKEENNSFVKDKGKEKISESFSSSSSDEIYSLSWDPNILEIFTKNAASQNIEYFSISDFFNWTSFFFIIFIVILIWKFFDVIYRKICFWLGL